MKALVGKVLLLSATLIMLSSCGRVRDFTFGGGTSDLNSQSQLIPSLALTNPLPLLGIDTGLSYIEIITASNPVSSSNPITLKSFSVTPGISGVTADFSSCTGAILSGSNSCNIYLNYSGGASGSSTSGTVSVSYQYADSNSNLITASKNYNFSMMWTNGTQGATTNFNYPQSTVQFVNTATLGPTRAYYSYTDPYGSASIQFAILDATTLPLGLTFDYSQGEIGGTPTGTQSSTLTICLVKNQILTSRCRLLSVSTKGALGITTRGSSPTCTSGGLGTDSDPYLLTNATDFDQCLRAEPTKSFMMTQDIDLGQIVNVTPITAFSGTLNGNNHTISNWTYTDPGSGLSGVALFRKVLSGAVIKDLKISGFSINGGAFGFVAALAGIAEDALFSNIELDNINISGYSILGGMIGQWQTTGVASTYFYQGGSIDRCKLTNVIVNNPGDTWGYVGGMVGLIDNTLPIRITRSSVRGLDVLGSSNIIGGLVGDTQVGIHQTTGRPSASLSIDSSFTSGNISGNAFTAGIIGAASAGDSLTNVGSTMSLTSSDPSHAGGGLVGFIGGNLANNSLAFAVSNSYFNGTFSGTGGNFYGTLIGDTTYKTWSGNVIIGNSYYNSALGTNVQFNQNSSILIGNYQGISSANILIPSTFHFWNSPWSFDTSGPLMPY